MAKYKPRDGSIKFKKATQNMSTKEKVDYIWEYYKWWILASIAAVSVIFYTINTHNPTTHLHIAVTSGFAHTSNQFQFDDSDDGYEEVFELSTISINPYGFTVDIEELSDTLDHLLLDDEQHGQYTVIIQALSIDFQTMPALMTFVGAGELDMVITYQHDFDAMASIGHFRNIRDLDVDLPDHIFIHDYGILLRYLPIFNDYIHPNNTDIELILGIVAGSSRTQEVENFLNELFE